MANQPAPIIVDHSHTITSLHERISIKEQEINVT